MCANLPIVHDLEGGMSRAAERDSGDYHNSWARVARMRSDCQHLKMRVPLAGFEVTDLMNYRVGEERTVEDGAALRDYKGFL